MSSQEARAGVIMWLWSDLPTGTVTMLFSDIEGSTLLLSRLGPTYTDALDAQRKVSRIAWAAHGGTEMGTEGDSFFVVFPTAPGAVAAATQAQRELAGYPWPGGGKGAGANRHPHRIPDRARRRICGDGCAPGCQDCRSCARRTGGAL